MNKVKTELFRLFLASIWYHQLYSSTQSELLFDQMLIDHLNKTC